jgi:purine nucleoside permease
MSEKLAGLSAVTRAFFGLYLALAIAMPSASDPTYSMDEQIEPVQVKVVVVTMFEIGADEGDRAGEFQLWKERRQLSKVYPFFGLSRLTF